MIHFSTLLFSLKPVMTSLHEITNRLTCFNMLDVLKSNIRLFEKAFRKSNTFEWTQEEFVECPMLELKEESNVKQTAVNTYPLRLCFKTVIISFYG